MTNGSDTAALDTHYEFFPSVRQGYRPSRTYDGTQELTGRSTLGVELDVEGVPADGDGWESAERSPSVDLRMYGPGDVTGIDQRQVVRVEPEPETSTFAPNYFPLVEFDRADLPWLFSPERADTETGKVRPWLTLVVVERGNDDVSFEADGTKPLPALTAPPSELPPVTECWAWAHVQVVGKLSDDELERALRGPSSQVVSRLLCPRNLDPNTRYTAAVVPTFEPSVRAGLGKEPYDVPEDQEPTLKPAWSLSDDGPVTLPIYYQWSFTTGDEGDFEALARKLDPTDLSDHGVGAREIDLSAPGPDTVAAPDGLTRKVGGALQSARLETPDYPATSGGTDTQKRAALRDLLNEPADTPGLQDSEVPVVGPPIYGQWYLPEDAGWELGETGVPEPPGVPESDTGGGLASYFHGWIHELNVDPQYRIPASYGTEVVQENQERLMEAAWKQFGDLEQANERLGRSQAGDLVGRSMGRRFDGVDATRFGSRVRDPIEFAETLHEYELLRRRGLIPDDALVEDLLEGQPTPRVSDVDVDIEAGGTVGGGQIVTPGDDVIGGTMGQVADDLVTGGTVEWGAVDGVGSGGRIDDVDILDDRTVTRTGLAVDERLTSNVGGTIQGLQGRLAAGDEILQAEDLREGDAVPDGSGAMDLARTATQTARLAELNSPSFRRLARQGGKLAKGVETAEAATDIAAARARETSDFGSDERLGSRFGGSSEPAGPTEPSELPTETQSGHPSESTGASTTSGPDRTDWRVDDAGTVLTLEEAVDRLDGPLATVPRTLLAIESVRDHCETARERLADLDDHLATAVEGDEEARREAVASLTERPTVGYYCRAIAQNTADALARQVGKLVAADPEPLSDAFDEEARRTVIERFESAHDELMAAVGRAEAAARDGEFDPETVQEHVETALAAIADVESVLGSVRDEIDGGVPPMAGDVQALSGRLPAERRAGTATDEELVEPTGTTDLPEPRRPTQALQTLTMDVNTVLRDGYGDLPGMLDASGWSKQTAAWRLDPGLLDRDVELAPILAAPEFDRPMYKWLKAVDQRYLLPGARKVPRNSVGGVETSSEFIESFMVGLNHEMGRELLWRKYPTDRRATYFRQFWEYIGEDDQPDIRKLHRWRDSPLGENRAPGITDDRVVLLIRGELLEAYPNTRIYAVKAVREDRTDSTDDRDWDRMPLLERKRQQAIAERANDVWETLPDYSQEQLERWEPKKPIFRGSLDPGITFLGFELASDEAYGETFEESGDDDAAAGEAEDETDYGWFFVLEEPVGETRFGLDVPADGDYGSVPYGIEYGPENDRTIRKSDNGEEYGWDGLSWGHLVDDADAMDSKTYVSVTEDNPDGGDGEDPWAVVEGTGWSTSHSETFDSEDAAEWGRNSAHVADITWQLPVRICIHADDILPREAAGDPEDDTTDSAPRTFVSRTLSDQALGGED